jgi:hypothetical protein
VTPSLATSPRFCAARWRFPPDRSRYRSPGNGSSHAAGRSLAGDRGDLAGPGSADASAASDPPHSRSSATPVLRRLWRDLTSIRVARIDVFVGDLAEQSYLASSIWQSVDAAVREGLSQGMHTVPPVITRWRSLDALLSEQRTRSRSPNRRGRRDPVFGHVGGEDTRPRLVSLHSCFGSPGDGGSIGHDRCRSGAGVHRAGTDGTRESGIPRDRDGAIGASNGNGNDCPHRVRRGTAVGGLSLRTGRSGTILALTP